MPIMSSLCPLLHFPSKENDRELETEKEKKRKRKYEVFSYDKT